MHRKVIDALMTWLENIAKGVSYASYLTQRKLNLHWCSRSRERVVFLRSLA